MTRESQYKLLESRKALSLGSMSSYTAETDPKRLGFTLARYKFVAKVVVGSDHVLEVGCGDGFASRVVAQHVGSLVCTDMDEKFIEEASLSLHPKNVSFKTHDMTTGPVEPPGGGTFNAAYSLDVLEHISPDSEGSFLGNVSLSIGEHGIFVCGIPSLESQKYASAMSVAGHVNCKTEDGFRATLRSCFRNVIIFGMNDETIHTGFGPMCHYRLAVCSGAKL